MVAGARAAGSGYATMPAPSLPSTAMHFTQDDIRRHFDARTLERGMDYMRRDKVELHDVDPDYISADVGGSHGEVYEVGIAIRVKRPSKAKATQRLAFVLVPGGSADPRTRLYVAKARMGADGAMSGATVCSSVYELATRPPAYLREQERYPLRLYVAACGELNSRST